jgi:serine/threonine protein kinase
MEYLEGETLAARLMKGPLPLKQVLRHAIDIADALDKAHRKGVTRRDLKPGNIMLAKSGGARQGSEQAKLLDFGLAKLKQGVFCRRMALSSCETSRSIPPELAGFNCATREGFRPVGQSGSGWVSAMGIVRRPAQGERAIFVSGGRRDNPEHVE